MPIVLIFVAVVLIAAGINNKISNLFTLLNGDLVTGSNGGPSFGVWLFAIVVVGVLGYIKEIRPITNAFLVLLFVVIGLSNKGFFANFQAAFTSPQPTNTTESSAGNSTSTSSNSGSNPFALIQSVSQAFGSVE